MRTLNNKKRLAYIKSYLKSIGGGGWEKKKFLFARLLIPVETFNKNSSDPLNLVAFEISTSVKVRMLLMF